MQRKNNYVGPTKQWGWKFWQEKDKKVEEKNSECPECDQGNNNHTEHCVRFN